MQKTLISTRAMEQYYGTHDVLHDAKRMKMKCKQLHNQCDEMKRLLEEENNIDSDYQHVLRFTLSTLGLQEPQEKERENIICIDGDSDSETDPQYNIFLNGLKEHGNAYALDREIDGSLVFIEYEAESGSDSDDYNDDEWEYGSRRKMNRHGFDIQDQSVKNSITMKSPRLSTNQTNMEHARGGEIVFPMQKPTGCLRVKGSMKNRHGYDVKTFSSRKRNIESCGLVGTRSELLSDNSGTRMKKIQCKPNGLARLGKKEKVCTVLEIDKGHFCHKPGPSNNVDRDEKYKVCERRTRKFVSGKNVMLENQFEIGERNKVQKHVKRCEVVKRTNLVDDAHLYQKRNDKVADNMWDRSDRGLVKRKNVIREDHENLHQKTSPRNLVEYPCKYVDRKLKGKRVFQEDDEADRKPIIRIDNENLYHRICPRKHYEGCNEAQACKKNEVHCHRRSIKVGLCSHKAAFGSCHHNVMKGSNTKIKNVEFDKHIMACKNKKRQRDLEEEINDVEILNGDAYLEKGIISSFVPAKRFHQSMLDEGLGSPSAPDVFRERVLSVLEKPFDKAEYKKHRKAIEVGSYFDYYPDLRNKLKRYRYKRGKCLTILRGFFFWLQNLTQEGAFQPWKDSECLAVEPRSLPSANSTDQSGW